jgi:glycosyltransferase involved in cell wall biosynthesis
MSTSSVPDYRAMPLLTIAIPTFNRASTLRKTLETIVAQLRLGVDVLISDNASADQTAARSAECRARYPQVAYRRNAENIGADRNFDAAISNAVGRFVWLFSDDDPMEADALDRVMPALAQNLELVSVFVNYSTYSVDDVLMSERALDLVDDELAPDGQAFFRAVAIGPIFCSSNIVRRSLRESRDSDGDGTGDSQFRDLSRVSCLSKRETSSNRMTRLALIQSAELTTRPLGRSG